MSRAGCSGKFGELKVIHLDSARALDFDELLERDDDLPDIVGWIRVGSDGSIAEPLEVGRCAQQRLGHFQSDHALEDSNAGRAGERRSVARSRLMLRQPSGIGFVKPLVHLRRSDVLWHAGLD